ncbi:MULTISPECIES: hypothetical protein [unclassified Pseudomonas]|uniref:hypothetical protein n=1 Tax=unclassified Pseudomonas TaxID=196821 RepID=UPI001587BBC5|nr:MULTISPECIES: hypothetical protein [unclassified Pseudomonas]
MPQVIVSLGVLLMVLPVGPSHLAILLLSGEQVFEVFGQLHPWMRNDANLAAQHAGAA